MAIVRVPVRIEYPVDGGPGVNVLHISTQPGGQSGDLGEALTAIQAMYTKMRENYPAGTTITLGEGMISDPLGAPTYVQDDVRTVTGSGSAPPAPSLLAIVAGWRTQAATRQGRGRTFFGPLHKDALDADGTPEVSVLLRTRGAVQDFLDDSQSANGWAFGVLSTKTGVFREASGVTVRDRFAVLRSRRG